MAEVVRWEPFQELMTLREAMDRLFEDAFVRPWSMGLTTTAPVTKLALDMYETDDDVIVKATIPGIDPEDLEITVTDDVLTIKGETKAEKEVKEEQYHLRERRYGAFQRSVRLPVPIVANEARSEYENGVLTITLPKAEEVKPVKISVKPAKRIEARAKSK
ncbi:MAG TPA: Hsp20/alpha crystallin family protein [Anaerolineae bacterium]|nr:Hsp20/alpha crystallin family protein [Anaerolineae bacterium]